MTNFLFTKKPGAPKKFLGVKEGKQFKFFSFKKLRSKLFVTFLAVILFVMLVSTIFFVTTSTQKIKSDMNTNLYSNSTAASIMLQNEISGMSGVGAYIAGDNSLKLAMGFGLSSQVDDFAASVKKKYAQVDELVITDGQGQIVYSSSDLFKNVAADLATAKKETSGVYLENNIYSVSCNTIKGDNDATVGYVFVAHNIEKDTSLLADMGSKLKCYVMLYRGNQLITMSDSNKKIYVPKTQMYGAVNSSIVYKSAGGVYSTSSTTNMFNYNLFRTFTTLKDINGNPVGLLAAAETDKALNDSIASIILSMLIIAILCAAAASFIIFMFATFLTKPINKLKDASERIALGDVDVDIETKATDEIGQLTRSFSSMVENIKKNANAAEKIAEGDLTVEIVEKSDKDILSKSLKHVAETLTQLNAEEQLLTKAAIDGNLDVRGNADEFNGVYKTIIDELNRMLDSIAKPISLASMCIENIADGELSEQEKADELTENYGEGKGYYSVLASGIHSVLDMFKVIFSEIERGMESAIDGQLSVRVSADSLKGDWRKLPNGVNRMLDAIVEPISETSSVLSEMSAGNLKVSVNGDYKGDHANLKISVNTMIESLSSYINEISNTLAEMSDGNLDVGITGDYKGDFVEIKNSINMIIESLNEAMSEIDTSAEQVATGSRQLSETSTILSQGSTEQAQSIEEITSSITEVSEQTRENATKANEANDLAIKAKGNAVQGKLQMQDMLNAMEEIEKSSENISNIIKVIDEIAFQTNILALNAAVEAARAGQHGKGFAVVAEEVRNLAARSSDAAKETTALIENSIKKVEEGTKIANNTASALNNITDGITAASDIVGGIARASAIQADSILEVNKAIGQVSKVTDANSAMAEESAAASEELTSQAETLKKMIEKFRFKTNKPETGADLILDENIIRVLEKIAATKGTADLESEIDKYFSSQNK